jgi:hypothetical protein
VRGLTEYELLPLWEEGEPAGPQQRASALLEFAAPELGPAERARLTVGQRDAALLELHVRTFGGRLEGFVHCPECAEPLEIELGREQLRSVLDARPVLGEQELAHGGYGLRFRPVNCADLDVAASARATADARASLVECCVLESRFEGGPVELSELPEEVIAALAERLAECDPQAEIWLALSCPECGHAWRALVDVASFLWAEVSLAARRLLEEVDALARSYGWTEADVLDLGRRRRALYLELALG